VCYRWLCCRYLFQAYCQYSTDTKFVKLLFLGHDPICITGMKDLQTERRELLERVQEVVTKNIITDRPSLTAKIRRENRRLKRMLKEIEIWKDELYEE
jgi:hypothetical protein